MSDDVEMRDGAVRRAAMDRAHALWGGECTGDSCADTEAGIQHGPRCGDPTPEKVAMLLLEEGEARAFLEKELYLICRAEAQNLGLFKEGEDPPWDVYLDVRDVFTSHIMPEVHDRVVGRIRKNDILDLIGVLKNRKAMGQKALDWWAEKALALVEDREPPPIPKESTMTGGDTPTLDQADRAQKEVVELTGTYPGSTKILKAVRILSKWRHKPNHQQQKAKDEIAGAFRVFWGARPTEEDFAKVMGGLIIFSEMAYMLAVTRTHPAVLPETVLAPQYLGGPTRPCESIVTFTRGESKTAIAMAKIVSMTKNGKGELVVDVAGHGEDEGTWLVPVDQADAVMRAWGHYRAHVDGVAVGPEGGSCFRPAGITRGLGKALEIVLVASYLTHREAKQGEEIRRWWTGTDWTADRDLHVGGVELTELADGQTLEFDPSEHAPGTVVRVYTPAQRKS